MSKKLTIAALIGLSIAPVYNMDASESAFLSRELEHIRAKAYDKKYPELLARSFIPVDNSVPSGAQTVTYKQYDQVGIAKIISDYADDLPRADVFGNEFTSRIKGIGTSYGYSIQEVRAAQMAGTPLQQMKANAARRSAEVRIDQIAQTGDASHGLLGFLNQPNASVYTIPLGVAGFQAWTTKTPDEIVADLNGIANFIYASTNGVEVPDTIILPLEQYTLIATKRMGDGSDTTILDFFLEASPFIQTVAPWYAVNGAGAAGADRMVCYKRDPDALQLIISQEFEQLPPQAKNLEVVTPCHARCGGVVCYYPLTVAYGDGI